ncbi:hypothetical protein D0469_02390 [Peribacillus saganii]|uniref:Uncharacterized protein n=2 Tax=Peribacillus saganii TaxID=2303992 RepID=A0A372LUK1_9BACI|nr:hypothetical protein D0469_02390 [Peribacillus saganii]
MTKWNLNSSLEEAWYLTSNNYYEKQDGYDKENYLEYMKKRQKKSHKRRVEKAKERGEEYYTTLQVRQMEYAQRLATY